MFILYVDVSIVKSETFGSPSFAASLCYPLKFVQMCHGAYSFPSGQWCDKF
jgi:hypothetical protein